MITTQNWNTWASLVGPHFVKLCVCMCVCGVIFTLQNVCKVELLHLLAIGSFGCNWFIGCCIKQQDHLWKMASSTCRFQFFPLFLCYFFLFVCYPVDLYDLCIYYSVWFFILCRSLSRALCAIVALLTLFWACASFSVARFPLMPSN